MVDRLYGICSGSERDGWARCPTKMASPHSSRCAGVCAWKLTCERTQKANRMDKIAIVQTLYLDVCEDCMSVRSRQVRPTQNLVSLPHRTCPHTSSPSIAALAAFISFEQFGPYTSSFRNRRVELTNGRTPPRAAPKRGPASFRRLSYGGPHQSTEVRDARLDPRLPLIG